LRTGLSFDQENELINELASNHTPFSIRIVVIEKDMISQVDIDYNMVWYDGNQWNSLHPAANKFKIFETKENAMEWEGIRGSLITRQDPSDYLIDKMNQNCQCLTFRQKLKILVECELNNGGQLKAHIAMRKGVSERVSILSDHYNTLSYACRSEIIFSACSVQSISQFIANTKAALTALISEEQFVYLMGQQAKIMCYVSLIDHISSQPKMLQNYITDIGRYCGYISKMLCAIANISTLADNYMLSKLR
jgi:hypothetical protein